MQRSAAPFEEARTRDPRHAHLAELDAVGLLAAEIAARSGEIESSRHLPADLAHRLAQAGLFRIMVPRDYGGAELHLIESLRVIEELSRIDGSVGWCVMIGGSTGLLGGFLPERSAREIYGANPDVITAGATAPSGKANVADGGYLLSGRWQWGSCVENCQWVCGGAVVHEGDSPRRLADGSLDARLMIFPADQVDVLDTWNASGLRGTGSHDFQLNRAFVPADRTIILGVSPPTVRRPLYEVPILATLGAVVGAVGLGIARRAIDELVELGAGKRPAGSQRLLLESSAVQERIGEAEAALRSARAFLFEAIEDAWRFASAGERLPLVEHANLRLASANAAWQSAKAVDLMYHAGGGSSVHMASPLQRCFRDVHVVTQHQRVNATVFSVAARVYAGLGPPPAAF
jgi:alkylation response protein AidB-like acyl-CoA dehydrogenase